MTSLLTRGTESESVFGRARSEPNQNAMPITAAAATGLAHIARDRCRLRGTAERNRGAGSGGCSSADPTRTARPRAQPFTLFHFALRSLPLTENWIHSQVSGLRGVRTAFYALHGENRELFPLERVRCLYDDLGPNALFFNRAWFKLFGNHPAFRYWLWRDKPGVIHAHFGPRGWQFLSYARRAGIPLVTSFYGADAYVFPRDPLWVERYHKLFQEGALMLAEGPAMGRRLVELGCPPEKVRVHNIGVSLDQYEFMARTPEAEEPIKLMVCGRFEEKKGFPIA